MAYLPQGRPTLWVPRVGRWHLGEGQRRERVRGACQGSEEGGAEDDEGRRDSSDEGGEAGMQLRGGEAR